MRRPHVRVTYIFTQNQVELYLLYVDGNTGPDKSMCAFSFKHFISRYGIFIVISSVSSEPMKPWTSRIDRKNTRCRANQLLARAMVLSFLSITSPTALAQQLVFHVFVLFL